MIFQSFDCIKFKYLARNVYRKKNIASRIWFAPALCEKSPLIFLCLKMKTKYKENTKYLENTGSSFRLWGACVTGKKKELDCTSRGHILSNWALLFCISKWDKTCPLAEKIFKKHDMKKWTLKYPKWYTEN